MAEQASHISSTISQEVTIVEFSDRKILEELEIREIEDELDRLIDGVTDLKLLLSFRNVEHLSSAALGMLINLKRKVDEQSGQLRLSDITPQIFEVFRITKLNKLFVIHETADQAIKSF